MSIVTRSDGINFVLYTYRDIIFANKLSLLRQQIADLEKENGTYVRFFDLGGGEIEVIFSKDPGYLLAESVADYFTHSENIIFCEQLPDQESAILIVIKEGLVFLDTLLPTSLLVDEFISLATFKDLRFNIYVHGNLPIAAERSDEKFAFPNEMVSSFEYLDLPLIQRLTPKPNFMLLSIEKALSELSIGKSKIPLVWVGIIVCIVVGIIIYHLIKPKTVVKPMPVAKPVVYSDPYANYKAVLMSPAPTAMITQFDDKVRRFMTIPGWEINSVDLNRQTVLATLTQAGGSADILFAWLQHSGVELEVNMGKATLSVKIDSPNRQSQMKIYPIKDIVGLVYDRLKIMINTDQIQIGAAIKIDNFYKVPIQLNVNNVTPVIIDLIGKTLVDLPIVLDNLKFNINKGLMSGIISFTVLGVVEQ